MSNLYGTNVSATIKPFTTADRFPTHEAQYGKGGYRTVESENDLYTIYTDRLETGTLVYVSLLDKIYKYIGDTTTNTSSDWEELVIPIGSDNYIIVDELSDLNSITGSTGMLAYVIETDEIYKYTSGGEWVLIDSNTPPETNNYYRVVNTYNAISNLTNVLEGTLAYVKDTDEIYKCTGLDGNDDPVWVKLIEYPQVPDISNLEQITHPFTNQTELTITHNLGKYPQITITDTSGYVIVAGIQYLNNNSVKITFSETKSGYVYLN